MLISNKVPYNANKFGSITGTGEILLVKYVYLGNIFDFVQMNDQFMFEPKFIYR